MRCTAGRQHVLRRGRRRQVQSRAPHSHLRSRSQVSKNASILEKAVAAIAYAQLVADPPSGAADPAKPCLRAWWGHRIGGSARPFSRKPEAAALPRCAFRDVRAALCARPQGPEVLELQEFYERMEQGRGAEVEAAVKKYRSLTPILCKVREGRAAVPGRKPHAVLLPERLPAGAPFNPTGDPACSTPPPIQQPIPPPQVEELVAGTNNGRSPQLAGYYAYWEQAVFNALAVMLLRALERLHAMFGPAAKQHLFMVCTALLFACSV